MRKQRERCVLARAFCAAGNMVTLSTTLRCISRHWLPWLSAFRVAVRCALLFIARHHVSWCGSVSSRWILPDCARHHLPTFSTRRRASPGRCALAVFVVRGRLFPPTSRCWQRLAFTVANADRAMVRVHITSEERRYYGCSATNGDAVDAAVWLTRTGRTLTCCAAWQRAVLVVYRCCVL
jgi:hypothetical protein